MEVYILRVGLCKKLYPHAAYIFSIGYYRSKDSGEDEYSKKLIYFYKYGNEPQFFLDKLIDLFKLRFEGDSIKFDYLTVYPTHTKDGINQNMKKLAEEFSKNSGLPYKQILRRNKDVKPSHEIPSFEERKNNLKGSIDVLEDVTGKNIIIFDNTSTTGLSLIDATNLLIEKGAGNIACICLGVGERGKASDWQDLNKTLKYSRIINICKGPYVPKEKHELWKKTH